jgi:hypothetical protein
MKLEKEQLARLQRLERRRGWRPKVDLSQIRSRTQMVEPISVGHGNNEIYSHGAKLDTQWQARQPV